MLLTSTQTRVLGSLIEKEIVTPENYPLSLNALVNACNQKSSREPIMQLTEPEVREALRALEDLGLAQSIPGDRVPKYEHRVRDTLQLRRDETAVLCLLLLRGPQTPGELRTRADRMHSFDDLDAVTSTLNRLASRTETQPLTAILPRQPGSRESRYTHLLSDMPAPDEQNATAPSELSLQSQLTELQIQVESLKARIELLESEMRHKFNLQLRPADESTAR